MRRLLFSALGALLVLAALALLLSKAWLERGGPYLEALPPYPYCAEAGEELAAGRTLYAMELAEAGGCDAELAEAEAEWNALSAVFQRCLAGVWLGTGEDAYGVGCAVVSDLVVFGDVRDLTRQGVNWFRGEAVDPFLVGLSAAGIALTFAPQVGAGASLLKGARRAGAVSERLAKTTVELARKRAWGPLAGMLTDAGRISRKLSPAKASRALKYADGADDLAALARFVEVAPNPLLGLRWGGKGAVRLADQGVYTQALLKGPAGVHLALERGGKALLARQPLVIFAAKTLYRNADAVHRLVPFILRRATWPWVAGAAAGLALLGALLMMPVRRRRPQRP